MNCWQCGAPASVEALNAGGCRFCGAALLRAATLDGIAAVLATVELSRAREGRVAELRDELARHGGRSTPGVAAFFVLVVALVTGTIWFGVVMQMGGDPWGGGHADYFCPRQCAGCKRPYLHAAWSTSENEHEPDTNIRIYCRTPTVDLAGMDQLTLVAKSAEHEAYALPWGGTNVWLSSVALALAWSVPVGILVAMRSLRRSRRIAAATRANIAELEGR